MRRDAMGLLSQLSSFERAKQETVDGEKQSGPAADPVVTETDKPALPPDPSSYLREALRQPAPGETRLQGTLVRIECDADGLVFVVQTGATLMRLRTASFIDIEITTYDPSVKGELTCGERKAANAVVATYVANADKKTKIDGLLQSIEFVPAEFKLKP